jgi:hypothetical protein
MRKNLKKRKSLALIRVIRGQTFPIIRAIRSLPAVAGSGSPVPY